MELLDGFAFQMEELLPSKQTSNFGSLFFIHSFSYGVIGAALMFTLFIFTFRPIRRKFWEFFWWSHQLLAVAGAILSAYHA